MLLALLGYWTNYPFHVFLILANEFCERFSYYGMRAVLVFFLWKGLGYSESMSTSIYHGFVVLCYLSPLLGAMIADGFLGKYKTILCISIIYGIGNVLMTASALKINESYTPWLTFIGLVVIGFGTGGIKPCVSSFGGDQFKDGQTKQKDSFFSLFYLTINVGSMISTIVIPYLRGNIYCFEDNCYSLCFGIPAILMIVSVLLFVSGTKWYVKHPAGDSILKRFFGCIGMGISRKFSCSKKSDPEGKDHWLDLTAPDYDQDFIDDVKDVMRVAWLFIPLPVFWALFDMQGSKWILQAQQMNGDFKSITVYPDMIHFLNPLLVVVLVPLLEYAVYPCLDKLKIPNRPLQRMTVGMLLATVSFLITGFLQMAINAEQPLAIESGNTKFEIINTSPYMASVKYSLGADGDATSLDIKPWFFEDYTHLTSGEYSFTVTLPTPSQTTQETCNFPELKAYQVFISTNDQQKAVISCHEQKKIKKTTKGESTAKVFNSLGFDTNFTLKNPNTNEVKFGMIETNRVSDDNILIDVPYKASYLKKDGSLEELTVDVVSKNGALYSLILATDLNDNVVLKQLEEIKPWSINIFLQTPQYVVMAVAETLFSVTGLGFAYTQAPLSMKSILTAIWLLTVCVGNIIIIIVQGASTSMNQAFEFFLYTILMAITTVAFFIMTLFYVYVTPRESPKRDVNYTKEAVSEKPTMADDHPDL